jgi:predicted enzyme related to lactoylglutathione lyase
MTADVLFAGIPTADLDRAIAFYTAVLGRPADIVASDDEVMWQVREGGWLYLVLDPPRAGHALVAVAVPDLDATIVELVGRGLPRPDIEVLEGIGRKAPVTDPEGNTLTFIEVPARG